MAPGRPPPLEPSKFVIIIFLWFFWVYGALGNMFNSVVSNSHFGKRPAARVKPILGFHVGPRIPNIGHFEIYVHMKVYGGI